MNNGRLIAGLFAASLILLSACNRHRPNPPAPVQRTAPPPADVPPAPVPADADVDGERKKAALRETREAFASPIHFSFDGYDLDGDARSILDQKRDIMARNPDLRLRIAGHSDDRGSDEYNMALGQRRAAAARRYLSQNGIDAERIEIVSFGEENPACYQLSDACWSKNRRAEFDLVGGAIIVPRSQ